MELKRSSWLVRWAYLFGEIPSTTSLCPLFWRIVLGTPLLLTMIVVVGGALVYLLLYRYPLALWHLNKDAIVVTVCLVGVVTATAIVSWLDEGKGGQKICNAVSNSFVGEVYRAIKSRYCPIVHLKED